MLPIKCGTWVFLSLVQKMVDVFVNVSASNSYKGNDANFVSITQNNFNFYGKNTFRYLTK
jgi:hypothetical protein